MRVAGSAALLSTAAVQLPVGRTIMHGGCRAVRHRTAMNDNLLSDQRCCFSLSLCRLFRRRASEASPAGRAAGSPSSNSSSSSSREAAPTPPARMVRGRRSQHGTGLVLVVVLMRDAMTASRSRQHADPTLAARCLIELAGSTKEVWQLLPKCRPVTPPIATGLGDER